MTFRLVFAFLAIYLIWGSTYLAIRVAVETMPPFLMAGCRFLISGLIMAAVVPRSAWRKLDRRQWQATAISGALFFAGGNGLVSWSERNIDSGVAALVIATIPGWMITLQWIMEKRRPRPRAVLGTILGFAGVAVLMYRPSPDIEITVAAVVGLIMAAFLWSVGSLYVRSAPLPENKVLAVAMQFLCGGGPSRSRHGDGRMG
ncbi:MAG: EamA family transporter [Candidatus Krumholzibacteriota bacterium]|nr:EamA family transporter [Candidatus Krumholzibacteriota bacterium]